MAQTGSYAMIMVLTSAAETPARSLASWIAQTLSQRFASNSSFVSPMQSTGIMPPSMILRTFLLIAASLSLKRVLRSEWPARTYFTPKLLTIDADTAPV